jgi:CRISPR-associated endonuclease/helicase Cas3
MGLVRMANIDPLVETARALCSLGARQGQRIHLCVYHSQHPLLVRSGIERRLDRLLNRKRSEALFEDWEMRDWLKRYDEPDQIFVVLATAVAEVGRDHDYDWAIVEPSSMRSIIQLAGRVRRHRFEPYELPNIHLLETNLRHLENGHGEIAFHRPGFESKDYRLKQRSLFELLSDEQLARIDAGARIRERENLDPAGNLADLEHAVLRDLMLGEPFNGNRKFAPLESWWTTRVNLTGEMQRYCPFRDDPEGRQRYGLLPNEDGEIEFRRFEKEVEPRPANSLLHSIDLESETDTSIVFWGEPDYPAALEALAESMEMGLSECAKRFGVVDLPAKGTENGWHYHPLLGFSRFK